MKVTISSFFFLGGGGGEGRGGERRGSPVSEESKLWGKLCLL